MPSRINDPGVAIDVYLERTLGHPRGSWTFDVPFELAQKRVFRWIGNELGQFGPVTDMTEAFEMACVYRIAVSKSRIATVYLATSIPWASVVGTALTKVERVSQERYLGMQTVSACLPEFRDVVTAINCAGFHVASEGQCRTISLYQSKEARPLSYWNLLFETDDFDPPWSSDVAEEFTD